MLSSRRFTYNARPYEPHPPQHRDHRPRRPRQDHAGRQAAAAVGHLCRARARAGAGHGLERPRARARHHHPRQELRDPLPRHAHQHRRHPRPRRLRRRGRARAVDGRRRAAAGRRGRGPDAADALRHAQGPGARPEADRGGEQGRPPGRAPGVGGEPDLRPLRQARRDRGPARFPGDLRLGAARLREEGARPREHRHGAAVRGDPRVRAGARRRSRRAAAAADLLARLLELRRQDRHRPHPPRPAQGRAGSAAAAGQHQGQGQSGPDVRGPGAQAGRRGRGRRHRADQRHRRGRHRRHAVRPRASRCAAGAQGRRADADHELPGQRLAARRPRGQVRHQPPDPRAPRARDQEQRGAARRVPERHRHLHRARPRRAAPDHPAREHAARRLRDRGVAPARDLQGDRRREVRAVRAADRRRRGLQPGRA